MSAIDFKTKVKDAEYVFVEQDDNWADEMDIEGYGVMTKEDFDKYVDKIEQIHYPIERGFGTNESNEYDTSDDVFSIMDAKAITKEQYDAFIFMFGKATCGDFFNPFGFGTAEYECQECFATFTELGERGDCPECDCEDIVEV